MGVFWARTAAVILAGVAFSLPGAAWADTIASLDPADSLKTAGDAERLCEEDFGGGPVTGVDTWVFALPDTRRFTSLTVVLTTGTRTATASGGIADIDGVSMAWVRAPAGAALIDANAYVTGAEPDGMIRFGLAYVCSGGGPKTPGSPSPSPSAVAAAAKSVHDPRIGGRVLVVASLGTAFIGAALLFVITRRRSGAG